MAASTFESGIGGGLTRARRTAVQLCIFLFTLAAPDAALAADGIGFAQAEEGTWYCRGDDPVSTLDCAREKCRKEGQGQECVRVRWCYSQGWAGLMTVWLEGFHTTQIVCGAPGKGAARNALAAYCEGNRHARSCNIFRLIAPDGTEHDVNAAEITGGKAK